MQDETLTDDEYLRFVYLERLDANPVVAELARRLEAANEKLAEQ